MRSADYRGPDWIGLINDYDELIVGRNASNELRLGRVCTNKDQKSESPTYRKQHMPKMAVAHSLDKNPNGVAHRGLDKQPVRKFRLQKMGTLRSAISYAADQHSARGTR